MKYLLDSSAIFRAIKENKVEALAGNYTINLARYELGNIVWKDCGLQAKISAQESKMLIKAVKRALGILEVLDVAGDEEGILEIAMQLRITFYDAAYVYAAKAKGMQLITEDSRLTKKAEVTVAASTLDDLR